MKAKIGVYVTHEVAKQLMLAARRSGTTRSDIVNEALERFLSPPLPGEEPGAEAMRQLGAIAKRLRRIHRDLEIVTEMFGLFVRYFLMITPPLPKREQDDAEKLGRERYQVFVAQIAKRITSDKGMVSEIMATIGRTHSGNAADAPPPYAPKRQEGVSHG
jgi:hypothetical protein